MLDGIYFAPADDGQGEAPETEAPDMGTDESFDSAVSDGQAEEYFFEAEDEKGNPVKFKSREEMAEAWRKSGMLHSDYTRKTQTLAQQRKELEEWKKQQETEIEQRRAEMKKFDEFLQKRPDVYQDLKKRMSSPDHNTAYYQAQQYTDQISGELKKELEELKGWKKQREMEEARSRIFEEMKSNHKDFDENKVSELISKMDFADPKAMIEILYYASKGRETPAQIEQRLADSQRQKQAGRMLPGSGSPSGSKSTYKSFDEAEVAALNEF